MKRLSILGAVAGDVIGSVYEFVGAGGPEVEFFAEGCRLTDDTVLTLAVSDWLMNPGSDVRDFLLAYGRKMNMVGYGPAFAHWLMSENPQPYGSCGNGSAMRVSAVGLVAKTEEEAMELARLSALPTHGHPEGIKGAQAVAVAMVMARSGKCKGEIRTRMKELFDYDLDRSFEELYDAPYEFHVLCQNTVPEALVCFFESESYEDCIARAILTNRDADTAAAIAGAVAGAYYGVPDEICRKTLECLPKGLARIAREFDSRFCHYED